jgi:hypothetical protein
MSGVPTGNAQKNERILVEQIRVSVMMFLSHREYNNLHVQITIQFGKQFRLKDDSVET